MPTTLSSWNFSGKGGQAAISSSNNASGASGTTSIGSGLVAFNYLGNGLTARKQQTTSLADAISQNEFISFKISPDSGKSITISQISLRPVSQNRFRNFALFSSRKAFSPGNEIISFSAKGIHLPRKDINVPEISRVASPVEFRLYVYGHNDEWESIGIGERNPNLNEPDLVVIGEIHAANQDTQPPSQPKGLTASSIASSSFVLNWTASTDNVRVTEYEVLGGPASTRSTTTSATISGLTPRTTYSMTVRARDAAGNVSQASDPLSVTTSDPVDRTPPSQPKGLTASSIASSSFVLNWTASTDNVRVTEYEVLGGPASTRSTTTSATISGLTPRTTYSMTVRARDAAGNVSQASDPLSVTTGAEESHPNSRSRMGMNLSSVYDYTSEQPFKDLFKSARPWNNNRQDLLILDDNGWVRSLNGQPSAYAYIMMNGDNPDEVYELGQYVLLYDGEGTIALVGEGVSRVSSTPGRIVYNVASQAGDRWIEITATNSNNYIRNIRLLPIAYESDYLANPWRPYILSLWSKFKIFRFMDWMNTNNSNQTRWTDRTTMSWYTYNDRSGIPLELIANICNRLHADAWICVPHLADNDYVAQMARLLRDTLSADLKIYVEYSNECWNNIFEQADYCLRQGRSAYPNLTEFEGQLRWYSRRAVEIFGIFASEFGGTSRLVRTLAAQHGNPWTLGVVLENENAELQTDALAVAPYFGHEYACEKHQNVKSWTLAQFFNDIRTVSLPLAWEHTRQCCNYASSKNKPLLAYEGGQHFAGGFCNGTDTGEDVQLNRKFNDANISTEMGNVYTMDLNQWKQLGGDMYCAFASLSRYSRWGYWGVLRYPKQNPATAPKYQALLNWIDNNPK